MKNTELHYKYWIGILLAIIVSLIALRYFDVPDLVDNFTFALTLSSLLLAILAIFYTIISSGRQETHLLKMNETNYEIKNSASEVRELAYEMNSALKEVPRKFDYIGSKLDDLKSGFFSNEEEPISDKDQTVSNDTRINLNIEDNAFTSIFKTLPDVGKLALYMFWRFYDSETDMLKRYITMFNKDIGIGIAGFLTGFKLTGLIEFKIKNLTITPINCDEAISNTIEALIRTNIESDDTNRFGLREKIDMIDKIFL